MMMMIIIILIIIIIIIIIITELPVISLNIYVNGSIMPDRQRGISVHARLYRESN